MPVEIPADHFAPKPQREPRSASHVAHAGPTALTLGAPGVVLAHIGTSPLYATRAVFEPGERRIEPRGLGSRRDLDDVLVHHAGRLAQAWAVGDAGR